MYVQHSGETVSNCRVATLLKPFRVPFASETREHSQTSRKRKRSYSYLEEDGSLDSCPSERLKPQRETLADNINIRKPHAVSKPRHSGVDSTVFRIPTMRTKSGEIIPTVMTGAPLGVRALVSVPPRPLHDPMADHAIVLYDPTIDDRETDEERKERIKLEARERELSEAREKACSSGLYNPHKSLRELLGETHRTAQTTKVPVVIDPLLGRKLRPHQVDGVKAWHLTGVPVGFILTTCA